MITEFSLFIFTTLGGLGAGMYAASAVFPVKGKRDNLLVSIVPLVLLAIGGIALMLHLGHPERALNAFANPSAGITMEAFASMALGAVLVIDFALTIAKGPVPRAFRAVGAVVAVILCCVMGLAYFKYDSVPAWHAWQTIALFLCGDLAMGALLLGALSKDAAQAKQFPMATAVLAGIAAVAIAIEGAHFTGIGREMMPFAGGAVLAAAGAVAAFFAGKKGTQLYWVAFALAFVGVVVARYAFYSVI